ncbi:hypothetical protein [Gimesia chilikensis]|uniref:hypothetical protein n=1 Tax=Gimesia chilikensis TaxID=2605989 RepID=UPI00118CBA11|nr:hypothetical protein [Gimesia chilikensis]QDT85303.1 hypothetical protein MalM14_29710 [Gimesia chilikensis]
MLSVQRVIVLLGSICLLACGCGQAEEGPPRRIVEGKVEFQGQPLAAGMIRFIPEAPGPVAVARIEQGAYRVDNKGGVPLGKHRVEVVSRQPEPELVEAEVLPDQGAATAISIPAQYNSNTSLSADVEVGDDPQVIDFQLD